MDNVVFRILTIAFSAVALLVLLYLVPTVARLARRIPGKGRVDEASVATAGGGDLSPELVAILAAAVAAASGMGVNEFRVVGVNRVDGSSSFNTPIWGHVDRLFPRSRIR
jgi:hypothetical protein